jgi:hypothetical protein
MRGPPLQNESLQDIALALMRLDERCLATAKYVLEFVASGRLASDPETIASAPYLVEESKQVLRQFSNLDPGALQFNDFYLEDRSLAKYWSLAVIAYRTLLEASRPEADDLKFRDPVFAMAKELEMRALRLTELITDTASKHQLTPGMRTAIPERWHHLDAILDHFHGNVATPRLALAW